MIYEFELELSLNWEESTVADQISFIPGERVELVGGPFAKFRGNVKEVDQFGKVLW